MLSIVNHHLLICLFSLNKYLIKWICFWPILNYITQPTLDVSQGSAAHFRIGSWEWTRGSGHDRDALAGDRTNSIVDILEDNIKIIYFNSIHISRLRQIRKLFFRYLYKNPYPPRVTSEPQMVNGITLVN